MPKDGSTHSGLGILTWLLPVSLIKETPPQTGLQPNLIELLPNWCSLFPNNPTLYQADRKQNKTNEKDPRQPESTALYFCSLILPKWYLFLAFPWILITFRIQYNSFYWLCFWYFFLICILAVKLPYLLPWPSATVWVSHKELHVERLECSMKVFLWGVWSLIW